MSNNNFYNFFSGSDTLAKLFTNEVINSPDPSPEDRVTAICQLADNVNNLFHQHLLIYKQYIYTFDKISMFRMAIM